MKKAWICLAALSVLFVTISLYSNPVATPLNRGNDSVSEDLSVQPSSPQYVPRAVPEIVERVVAAEARGEPLEGQMAVAQTILERAQQKGIPYEEVVAQPLQYADPIPYEEVTDSVKEACYRVFYLGERVTDEPITYFYSVRDGFVSEWHEESLVFVEQIGNHKFFKAVADNG